MIYLTPTQFDAHKTGTVIHPILRGSHFASHKYVSRSRTNQSFVVLLYIIGISSDSELYPTLYSLARQCEISNFTLHTCNTDKYSQTLKLSDTNNLE